MLRKTGFALAFAALLPAAAVAERPTEVVTRTGQWVLRYDEEACHLIGQFGTGEDGLLLRFTRYQPGDSFDLAITGKRFASSTPRKDVTLDFGLGGDRIERVSWNGKADDVPITLVSSVRIDGWERTKPFEIGPAVTAAQEASVKSVTVRIPGKAPLRIEFGPLDKPFKQMRDCSADLVRFWGFDPDVQGTLSRPLTPATPPQSWAEGEGFPYREIGSNGQVQFRLDVDAGGKVSACHILARSDPDQFSKRTCDIMMRRARFVPALDAKGTPVPSFFVSKFNWQLGS